MDASFYRKANVSLYQFHVIPRTIGIKTSERK